MRLTTLAGLELEGGACRRRKPLVLLAYLVAEGPQPRHRLARLFWPRATDPRNRLSVALSRLRREAPGAALSDDTTVRAQVPSDLEPLREALGEGDADEAEARYGGAFLADVRTGDVSSELESWILETRERLARRTQMAMVAAAERDAGAHAFRRAAERASRAWRLPGAPPAGADLLERLHALLVAGDASDAAPLRDEAAELGLSLTTDRARARAALRAARAPSTLPRAVTSFVGRDAERVELGRILGRVDRPLVTLLGPGGTGKTRLALALARDASASGAFEGGAHFVPLEDVASAADVPATVADVLGVVPRAGERPSDALARTVGSRRTLWILDNLDHLVDDPRPVAALLAACPSVSLLATSRRRLDIEEESVYPLGGLPTASDGEGDNEAVRLFVERARRTRLDYRPDAAERRAIADICRRVDGSPLAIELAAVWLRHGSAADAAAALARSFDAIGSSSRNLPDRHRSLRASFEVSLAHLDPTVRDALRRIAVFQGGFDVEAAERVTGLAGDALDALTAASLLAAGSDGRFALHPVTRSFALESLSADPALRGRLERRHARYYLERARTWSSWLDDARQAEGRRGFERERANLAAAERWATRYDPDLALELVDARRRDWRVTGRFEEGRRCAEAALKAAPGGDPARVARARHVAGTMAYHLADFPAARRNLERALDEARRAGDVEAESRALQTLGDVAIAQHRLDDAAELFGRVLDRARASGDTMLERSARTGLGSAAGLRGDLNEAYAHFRDVLELARDDGTTASIATSLFNLGTVARERGDLAEAEAFFDEALATHRKNGDRWGATLAGHQLGCVALERGRHRAAEPRLREALATYREMGDAGGAASCAHDLGLAARGRGETAAAVGWFARAVESWLELGEEVHAADPLWGLAIAVGADGHPELAAGLFGVEDALRARADARLDGATGAAHAEDVASIEARLGRDRFERLRREGRAWSPRRALAVVAGSAGVDE